MHGNAKSGAPRAVGRLQLGPLAFYSYPVTTMQSAPATPSVCPPRRPRCCCHVPPQTARCRRRSRVALSLLGFLAVTIVHGQPFTFTLMAFAPELTEASQRSQDNYVGFVFGFANATVRCAEPSAGLHHTESCMPASSSQVRLLLGDAASVMPGADAAR